MRAGPPAIWALTVQYFVADSSMESGHRLGLHVALDDVQ
jgi:hypothetical protein